MARPSLRNSALAVLATSMALLSATGDRPGGNRTTPPTLNSVAPLGVARGTTAEITVEGLNLTRASAVYFSRSGLVGRILRVKELPDLPDIRLGENGTPSTVDLGPLPPRNQVTIEVEVAPDADVGPVSFRLLTPLGTSPEGKFLIEPYYGETPDQEPNDSPETAVETFLPAILTGTISRPGDVDYFKIRVKAGQQISFENAAMLIGSTLQPVVTILDAELGTVREFGASGGAEQLLFWHRFEKAGDYYIRVSDYQLGGRASHFYRIMAGEFPLVQGVYPLGLRRGFSGEVALRGSHLASSCKVEGKPSPDSEDGLRLRPQHAFNEVRLAVGDEPEIESQGGSIPVPVTVNGRIAVPAAENRYRFQARKGEQLILEVEARRLGSDLDSSLEVLDAKGNHIERAVVRPIWQTNTTLRDHNSSERGIRLEGWKALAVGDYVMIGSEIVRVEALPLSPDADTEFEAFGGQRLAYFDTSSEAHAIDAPVYKVQIHPPGASLSPNGLPVAHLYYRNDDGGPGYGTDSLLHFTAPADGEYVARIRDAQGLGGDTYSYRLTLRHPHPDFRLTVRPPNPNVPAGGAIPLTVTASRRDGFDAPIDVLLTGLPPHVHATRGAIGQGQVSTTIVLSADADATLTAAVPLNVIGAAAAGASRLEHAARPGDLLKLIAVVPRPDILVAPETKEITIEPGGRAQLTVSIARQGDFHGRVPVEVRNLPPRVRVLDVGLNGVLINEDESRRSFTLEALPTSEPVDQVIYVSGEIETRSPQQSSYASAEAIWLHVRPKPTTTELAAHP
jgi:hypothetical protein